MTRAELPSQFSNNGRGEHQGLSPKDRRLFVNNATNSPAPDIDTAAAILPKVKKFYKELGVPSSDRKKQAQTLETLLFEGTAKQQTRASNFLESLNETYEALKSSLRQEKI
jgi:hypothetical protein